MRRRLASFETAVAVLRSRPICEPRHFRDEKVSPETRNP